MALEPSPRSLFCSFQVKRELYIWGGKSDNFEEQKDKLASTIYRYDPYKENWDVLHTYGSPPNGLLSAACVSVAEHFYVYGGWDGRTAYGSLHQLDICVCIWTQLSAGVEGMERKYGCGMVAHGKSLVLFGGVTEENESDGSDSRVHIFDLEEKMWSHSLCTESRPPACSLFPLTKTDNHHAVLFGGDQAGYGETSDVYVLDLERMHWSKLDCQEPHPSKRCIHAAACFGYDSNRPQLLVSGGVGSLSPVDDFWILDLQSRKWKRIPSPEKCEKKRLGHCMAAFSLSPELMEVVLFGGSRPQNFVADTALLRFEQNDEGDWILTDYFGYEDLGNAERLRMKRTLLRWQSGKKGL